MSYCVSQQLQRHWLQEINCIIICLCCSLSSLKITVDQKDTILVFKEHIYGKGYMWHHLRYLKHLLHSAL